ncbi:MAG: hypothetical protein WA822_17450, partial [Albidovulum sp.]
MTRMRPITVMLALALGLGTAAPVLARDGVAGPYLAGRLASRMSDYGQAADYFTRALLSDPANPGLLENALISQVGRGTVDKALPLAGRLGELG